MDHGMLNQQVIQWTSKRGISQKTLEQCFVGSEVNQYKGKQENFIIFPYFKNKELINRKKRLLSSKEYKLDKGKDLSFFNEINCKDTDQVFITEGEIDALSLVESGIPINQVLSVPNGATNVKFDNPNTIKGFSYILDSLRNELSNVTKFILVTDNDNPGRNLRKNLAGVLGQARCWYIDFPSDVKDANEFLLKYNKHTLKDYIERQQKEWPIEGLYKLSEIPEPGEMTVWRPGFLEWESKVGFAPGTISIITGQPGSGKTIFMMQLFTNILKTYNLNGTFASFETKAKPHHRRNIRQYYWEKLERDITDLEIKEVDDFIESCFNWIIQPNRSPDLNFILDTAESSVIKFNSKILQIDPWNKLENTRPNDLNETEYIGKCLDTIIDFATDFNVHVQVIAHPSKNPIKNNRLLPPLLEDISGSKHWDNKTDFGCCVWRPTYWKDGIRQTNAEFHVLKSRYQELGYPCKLHIKYDLSKGIFIPVDYETIVGLN